VHPVAAYSYLVHGPANKCRQGIGLVTLTSNFCTVDTVLLLHIHSITWGQRQTLLTISLTSFTYQNIYDMQNNNWPHTRGLHWTQYIYYRKSYSKYSKRKKNTKEIET